MFTMELFSKDRVTTGSVMAFKIATLYHELGVARQMNSGRRVKNKMVIRWG